jgi:hypothetical protein
MTDDPNVPPAGGASRPGDRWHDLFVDGTSVIKVD